MKSLGAQFILETVSIVNSKPTDPEGATNRIAEWQSSTLRRVPNSMRFSLEIGLRLWAVDAHVNLIGKDRPVHALSNAAILLVEDDEYIRGFTAAMLHALGYDNLTLATNGEEAVSACTQADFGVILMDCDMPVMDGWEATRRIREQGVQTPIVAYTASVTPTNRSRCRLAGMDDYLVKPAQPSQLLLRLEHWLAQSRLAPR